MNARVTRRKATPRQRAFFDKAAGIADTDSRAAKARKAVALAKAAGFPASVIKKAEAMAEAACGPDWRTQP